MLTLLDIPAAQAELQPAPAGVELPSLSIDESEAEVTQQMRVDTRWWLRFVCVPRTMDVPLAYDDGDVP